jgi:hypothetical protein
VEDHEFDLIVEDATEDEPPFITVDVAEARHEGVAKPDRYARSWSPFLSGLRRTPINRKISALDAGARTA